MPQNAETLYAPHGQPGSFFTPWGDRPHGVLDALRWHFSDNPYNKSEPPQVEVIENDGTYLSKAEHSAAVTWIGHASFAIVVRAGKEDAGTWLPYWFATSSKLPSRPSGT